MSRPPFGDPGGCPTIALFSSTTNHSPFGGCFSTAWTRLKAKSRRRRAGQFGAQKGDGASKRLARRPPTDHRTGFRASCSRTDRGLNQGTTLSWKHRDRGLIWPWAVRGRDCPGRGCGRGRKNLGLPRGNACPQSNRAFRSSPRSPHTLAAICSGTTFSAGVGGMMENHALASLSRTSWQ
jgi:hypothetical protein